MKCSCGIEAGVIRDHWKKWVQLAPHNQPSGLGCLPGRLQPKEDRGTEVPKVTLTPLPSREAELMGVG